MQAEAADWQQVTLVKQSLKLVLAKSKASKVKLVCPKKGMFVGLVGLILVF